MITDSAALPRNRSLRRKASGSTRTPRIRISSAPQSSAGQRLPQPPLIERQLLEHLEAPHPRRQPITGQVGDVGVELPQPVSRAVVADQPGPHDGAVGIDDPPSGGPHRAVIRVGVGDLFAAIEHAGATAYARLRQAGRPQACLPDRAAVGRHFDLAVEIRVGLPHRNLFREHTSRLYPGRGSSPAAGPGRAGSRLG